MFSAIFRRAQATVDNAIDSAVNRVIIAAPFLVAGAFATAALSVWLHSEYDSITANLIMAAIFAILGLLAVALFGGSQQPAESTRETSGTPESAIDSSQGSAPNGDSDLTGADRELVMAALSSAAPIALPGLLRLLMKNLPLIAVILAALFVMTRSQDGSQQATSEAPPA